MKIIVIDNYDSFTYNLVHSIKKISNLPVDVVRNDEVNLADLERYDKIVLSPGPGIPEEAGLLLPVIKEFAPKKCILGVCLGHQAIGEAFGGNLINMNRVLHGIATPIKWSTAAQPSLMGCPIRLWQAVIIPGLWMNFHSPIASKLPESTTRDGLCP